MAFFLPDGELVYRGDVSDIEPGTLLGHDEAFRPYEVLSAEFVPETYPDDDWPDGVGIHPNCTSCGRLEAHTHVALQYATPETLRRLAPNQGA